VTGRDGCPVRWCDEAGEHLAHRKCFKSVPTQGGRCVLGVTVTQHRKDTFVELVLTFSRGVPVIVPLEPGEATRFGELLGRAGRMAAHMAVAGEPGR
jgi:hypothetical protein